MGGEENWDVKPAQIYSTLARLQESGHIVEDIDGVEGDSADRRVYTITEKGQTDLVTWFNTPVTREHQRDEVFAKLMLAIATEVAKPRQVLQIQRAKLYQDLHALTVHRSKVDPQKDLSSHLAAGQCGDAYRSRLALAGHGGSTT